MVQPSDFDREAQLWSGSNYGKSNSDVICEIFKRMRVLEEKMKILEPTQEQMDKYPSLRDAFEQFLVIRKLTTGE